MARKTYSSVLKSYEMDAVLDFFLHYMPLDQRGRLMAEMPVVYNKLMGSEIVVVKGVSDERRISPPYTDEAYPKCQGCGKNAASGSHSNWCKECLEK